MGRAPDASARPTAGAGTWLHGWDTPAAAWWGYGAMNSGGLFDDSEVALAGKTYSVIAISRCGSSGSTAADIMNVSARLKAVNPKIKVIQYWNGEQTNKRKRITCPLGGAPTWAPLTLITPF